MLRSDRRGAHNRRSARRSLAVPLAGRASRRGGRVEAQVCADAIRPPRCPQRLQPVRPGARRGQVRLCARALPRDQDASRHRLAQAAAPRGALWRRPRAAGAAREPRRGARPAKRRLGWRAARAGAAAVRAARAARLDSDRGAAPAPRVPRRGQRGRRAAQASDPRPERRGRRASARRVTPVVGQQQARRLRLGGALCVLSRVRAHDQALREGLHAGAAAGGARLLRRRRTQRGRGRALDRRLAADARRARARRAAAS
mmetsp:Transcript_10670/g.24762  ORF Transcript_10670/g.24762 Transcript_10670/m.24762 type:complete len:258 (+) Transcript_10670:912-1685(+)